LISRNRRSVLFSFKKVIASVGLLNSAIISKFTYFLNIVPYYIPGNGLVIDNHTSYFHNVDLIVFIKFILLKPFFEPTICVRVYEVSKHSIGLKAKIYALPPESERNKPVQDYFVDINLYNEKYCWQDSISRTGGDDFTRGTSRYSLMENR
jgi:hypothetical protein